MKLGEDEDPDEFDEDNVDVQYERVIYLRPKFSDDHFLIKDKRRLYGKSLAFYAKHALSKNMVLKSNLEIIGLILHGKYEEAIKKISEIKQNTNIYPLTVISLTLPPCTFINSNPKQLYLLNDSINCIEIIDGNTEDQNSSQTFDSFQKEQLKLAAESHILEKLDNIDIDEHISNLELEINNSLSEFSNFFIDV